MYVWPAHFPKECPPGNATDVSGLVYRFIGGRNAREKDFTSHYERNPSANWEDPCKARGLSVVRTILDCYAMRDAVPSLRPKLAVVANVETKVGLIAPTPSNSCDGHCTWWRDAPPEEVYKLFTLEPTANIGVGK